MCQTAATAQRLGSHTCALLGPCRLQAADFRLGHRRSLVSKDGKVYEERFEELVAKNRECEHVYSGITSREPPSMNAPPPVDAGRGTFLFSVFSLFASMTLEHWLNSLAGLGGVTVDGQAVNSTFFSLRQEWPWACIRLDPDTLKNRPIPYGPAAAGIELILRFKRDKLGYRSVSVELAPASIKVVKERAAACANNPLADPEAESHLHKSISLAHFMLVHAFGEAPSKRCPVRRPQYDRSRNDRRLPRHSKHIATHWFCDHRPGTNKADGCCANPIHAVFGTPLTNKVDYLCHRYAAYTVPVRRLILQCHGVELPPPNDRHRMLLHHTLRDAPGDPN